jgi:hypothetical protein
MTEAESIASSTIGGVAFASWLDLAQMRIGDVPAEACDACNTVNLRHTRLCRCCAHKLPAFYGSRHEGGLVAGLALPRRGAGLAARGIWAAFSAAFSRSMYSLWVVTKAQPGLASGVGTGSSLE